MSEKSLLTTINTGFDVLIPAPPKEEKTPLIIPTQKVVPPKPKIVQGSEISINTGYEFNIIPTPPQPKPELITTVTTIVPESPPEPLVGPETFPESVKDSVSTGYGKDDKLHVVCIPPKRVSYLAVENYLSEFRAESEKKLARSNLGVYSIEEVNNVVANQLNNYVTKEEFHSNQQGIDSTLKAYADYQIPETLFKI